MRSRHFKTAILALGVLMGASSCSVDPVSAPSPTGPSELALSLALAASPDTISQDGVSTSRLTIMAREANSQPVSGLSLRVDILVPTPQGLVVADYGSLSNRWPSTGTDGSAVVVYRAPPQPASTVTDDTIITLRVTPVGSNYDNAVSRTATVKLMRPGVILPPTRMVPRFTFSPSAPREHDVIFFDASSSSDPDSAIVSYSWDFGDGTTGTGRQAQHAYELAATYGVVLTVSDAYGTRVSTPVTAVTVGTSPNPVARFTFSPTGPEVGKAVVFNGVGSTAAPGRRIVGYNWDLGDGTFVEGQAVSHTFAEPGTFAVVLMVTDDAGRTGVSTSTVTVKDLAAPVAAFTISPTSPVVGTIVVFNSAASTVGAGRQIVDYTWDFGDGSAAGHGEAPTHVYGAEGTFTVVLTITDDTGRKGVKSSTVTVAALSPTADFPDQRWFR